MKDKYDCSRCDNKTDGRWGNDDETWCEDCFNELISRAEMAYESQREDGI